MTCHGCQKDRGSSTEVSGRHYCIICAPTAQDMALEIARAAADLTPDEVWAIRAAEAEHAAGLREVALGYLALVTRGALS